MRSLELESHSDQGFFNVAGENDIVGAQSGRNDSGIWVAKHQPCSFFFSSPLRLVLKGVQKIRTRMNGAK